MIPESVVDIEPGVFYGCSALASITLPRSITQIGDYSFYKCGSLTSIHIPDGVTSIGEAAFWSCSSLTDITIPDFVTSIGDKAFGDCSSLTSIIIPESMKSVGWCAFEGCSALKDVYCYAKEIPTTYYNQVFDNLSQTTLHIYASVLEKYKNTAPWSQFGCIVPIDGEDTKVVDCRSANVVITDIYNESGRRRERLGCGINIIRMSDGTVRKVLVRIGN